MTNKKKYALAFIVAIGIQLILSAFLIRVYDAIAVGVSGLLLLICAWLLHSDK